MNCCGNKKSDWCSDLPLHYTDEEGRSYCIFHTPEGCKAGIEGPFFNRLIFERIRKEAESGQNSCDLSGTVLDWDIKFSDYGASINLGRLNLSGAIFHGEVSFLSTTVKGDVDFSGATFCKGVDFENTIFNGLCNFKEALFRGMPSYFDTIFNEFADFSGASFDKGVFLTWGCFKKGSSFEGAHYGERVILKRPVVA